MVITIAVVFVVYLIVFSTIPYIGNKPVGETYVKNFSIDSFYGDTNNKSVDRVALVESTEDSFHIRIQMIQMAKESIDITTHTIGTGETTNYFFGEVLKAADRGVKVRFLTEALAGGMFSGENLEITKALASHPNIEVSMYGLPNLFKPWEFHSLLHDKFMNIDNKMTILGGRNIGDVYFNPPSHEGRVTEDRDVLVFNTAYANTENADSVVYQTIAYMDWLWEDKTTQIIFENMSQKKIDKASKVQIDLKEYAKNLQEIKPYLYEIEEEDKFLFQMTVPSNKVSLVHNPIYLHQKEPWVAYTLAQLALDAKESIYIQSPYSTGNKKILDLLHKVNDKGVEIVMLTNSLASSPNYPAYSNYYGNRKKFIDTGTTIYEYQNDKHSIHAKTYIFDKRISAVGSFNMDDRSMYIDTETMLIIDSEEFYETLEDVIHSYQDNALKVDKDGSYVENDEVEEVVASRTKKIMMSIVSVFSRLFQFLI